MRVLLVCDCFLKYVIEQALALKRQGLDVRVLCRAHAEEYGGSRTEREADLQRLHSANVQVWQLPGRVRELHTLLDVRRLRRAIALWAPDIVHAHDPQDPRLLAIWTVGARLTMTVHDVTPHPGEPEPWVAKWVVRRMRARADAIVVHGAALRDALLEQSPNSNVYIVPHGVATSPEPLLPPKRKQVLFLGRLEQYKGVDVLLESMRLVWGERPNIHLMIAGAGALQATIPTHPAITTDLRYIPDLELPSLFANASIVALPYIEASQSGVGALALGYGIPVVVTRTGSLPDIAYRSDMIAEPGDPVGLKGVILRYVDHDFDFRRGLHDWAARELSWDAAAGATIDIFERVIRF